MEPEMGSQFIYQKKTTVIKTINHLCIGGSFIMRDAKRILKE
jgi:S1-C subfamily serine protease